jgi:transaldolase
MEFFIDSANIDDIKKAKDMGLVDGVTTNPTLIKKAGKDHKATIQEISKLIDGPISVETLGDTAEEMLEEANEYIGWGNNIVIKIVMTPEGMKAVKQLSAKNIKTNVTLVFSPLQGLIAAKAGATYISPFLGRLDDIGHDGLTIIEQTRTIFDNYQFKTKILAASIRHPMHILDSAQMGADVATIPADTLFKLFDHPLTTNGIQAFIKDAEAWATRAL